MGTCREGYYEGEGRDLQGGLSMERMGPARRAARRVNYGEEGRHEEWVTVERVEACREVYY